MDKGCLLSLEHTTVWQMGAGLQPSRTEVLVRGIRLALNDGCLAGHVHIWEG